MITFLIKLFIRHFIRYKLFNSINILGLAIGLAFSLIIGAWLHFELTYDSSFKKADRLYRVIQHIEYEGANEWVAPTPGPLAAALLNSVPGIENACRVHYTSDLIFRANGKSFVEEKVLFVDSSFLTMFSFPSVGPGSIHEFNRNQVILTRSAARKYFGQNNPLGEFMQVSGNHQVIVTGIIDDLPANCHFDFEILLPLSLAIEMHHEVFTDTWNPFDELDTYIEIRPGMDIGNLDKRIAGLKSNYVKDCNDQLLLQPVKSIHTRTDLKYDQAKIIDKSTLFIFTSVAIFLLVVAIINFMIFSIALSADHVKEAGIRRINGSSVFNIVTGQLLASFVTVLLSLVFSLIIIELIAPYIRNYIMSPVSLKYFFNSGLFIQLLLIIVIISLAGGLIPGLKLAGVKAASFFRSTRPVKIEKNNFLKSLVIVQFTISLSSLIFAFAVVAQLRYIRKTNIGFDKNQLISVRLFDVSKIRLIKNFESFVNEMKSLKGIEDVSFACSSPALINTSAGEVDWDGRENGESMTVQWNSVFYNYFTTIGVPMIAGRDFSSNFQTELASDKTAVFILNETAVRDMNLTNEEVLGRDFELYGRQGPVIGVVKDFHFKSLREKIPPMAFFMLPWYYNDIIIRTVPGNPPPLAPIEKTYKKFLSETPFVYSFVNDQVTDIYKGEKNLLTYNSIFAFLMILISSLGLSSLSLLILRSKTREIGIRKINGASVMDILRLLFGYFGKWILFAVIISVPVGIMLSVRWMDNFAYKTNLNIIYFIIPVLIIVIISALSIFAQVFKASRTNPADILRYE